MYTGTLEKPGFQTEESDENERNAHPIPCKIETAYNSVV